MNIDQIAARCPDHVDLTNAAHLDLIKEIVAAILKNHELREISRAESEIIESNDRSSVFILLALKLAKSKILVRSFSKTAKVSVVFAVFKEHNRIKRKNEHLHGEDFLRRKVMQLEWLFGENKNIEWELVVVDDGCPDGSGQIAQEIVENDQLGDRVRVLFLDNAIKRKLPIAKKLETTKDSQKGGAIVYGMWDSIRLNQGKDHIVVYTDADLSTHLGQLGCLIDPIISEGQSVAIGSRREPESVVVKQGTRNDRGKLFIYLWKRLLPELGNIIDTQCGFKAFRSETAANIIEDLIEQKFAFDIELLLKAELLKPESVSKVPVAWIDSEEASTTTNLQPYLSMLKSIVKMYRKYLQANPNAEEFSRFIESLDEDSFNELVANIPGAILRREPFEFADFDEVSVPDLERAIGRVS